VRHDLPASASSFAERSKLLRQHLPEHRASPERIFCLHERLASSFAYTPDSVRLDFGPMRRDLADSASTFAEPTSYVLGGQAITGAGGVRHIPENTPLRVAHNVYYVKYRAGACGTF
jgi:hypothetical protein